uniref:G-protein coupled receptors family 1 profile domain-containing protein n=1 Tax=Chinchilla lanigera TaxID=34839 RepID=A0A8C2W550_CHILA
MHIRSCSEIEITTFFLIGIPGLEPVHVRLSISICLMYLVAILGNCTILFVIETEPSLHAPMYYFLSVLAVPDLGISPNACFAQEFFIHGFTNMESSVPLVMSFDRFLAIRNPLRYNSILTSAGVAKTGLVLTYCRKSLLSHSYCLHQDVMRLACSDNTVNFFYGFFVALCMMSDGLFIAVSYVSILTTVMGIASHRERLKALNTCVSHICAVLIVYVPIIALASMHRFGKHKSPMALILSADVFLLVPPLMNPIIYCVKTKQIRQRVLGKLGLN